MIRRMWARFKRRLRGEQSDDSTTARFALIVAGILGGLLWVVAQAAVYQVVDRQAFIEAGEKLVRSHVSVHGERGRILDRTGRNPIAISALSRSAVFYGAPPYVNRVELAYTLAAALSVPAEDLVSRLMVADSFAFIKRNLRGEEIAVLNQLNIPYVSVITEPSRLYPLGTMLGPVVGSLLDNYGNRGLEAYYDAYLRADSQVIGVLRDARRRGLAQRDLRLPEELNGADLVLNIDTQIQYVLESALYVKVEEEKALGGMGIVLDPRTFEILAMANVPSMDPNDAAETCAGFEAAELVRGTDNGTNPCRNKVISFVFEPGSVAKIFALAAGIESGRVTLATPLNGHFGICNVGRFVVTDVKKVGVVSALDAVKYSSNCAMSELGRLVGASALHATLARLGFGKPTGIDLPGEASGVLRPADKWSGTDAQVAAYGYSYSVTLMQIARAVAAIANGGLMMRPLVAREVRNKAGTVLLRPSPGEPTRVLSEKTAAAVREAMKAVVMEEGGTGKAAKPAGYTAAGKTGTARLNSKVFGAGGKKPHIMSFAGFAPADEPRIVVVVSIIAPQVHPYAGQVAAPVFREVVERALPLLGVAPGVEQTVRSSR